MLVHPTNSSRTTFCMRRSDSLSRLAAVEVRDVSYCLQCTVEAKVLTSFIKDENLRRANQGPRKRKELTLTCTSSLPSVPHQHLFKISGSNSPCEKLLPPLCTLVSSDTLSSPSFANPLLRTAFHKSASSYSSLGSRFDLKVPEKSVGSCGTRVVLERRAVRFVSLNGRPSMVTVPSPLGRMKRRRARAGEMTCQRT